jgi:hypothetical protein
VFLAHFWKRKRKNYGKLVNEIPVLLMNGTEEPDWMRFDLKVEVEVVVEGAAEAEALTIDHETADGIIVGVVRGDDHLDDHRLLDEGPLLLLHLMALDIGRRHPAAGHLAVALAHLRPPAGP